MKSIESYLEAESNRFESVFFEMLKIPSISADPEHKPDMLKMASTLNDYFKGLGLKSEIISTETHPLVYAETPPVEGAPTVLVYGHYDVQPPDPLNLWKTPPFEPTVRDGSVFARGATDDKGQFLTHVFGLEAWLKTKEKLPLQIKFLIEGEEEVGSHALETFLKEEPNRKKLACDCVVVSDTSMFGPGQPAITYGLRGVMAFELFLSGPSRDLHSGDFGGTLINPSIALIKMLSAMIDENGKIQVPDFYKDVKPISERERSQFAMLPFDETHFFNQIGLEGGTGEQGFTTLERRWARPAYDINGLTAGYQGEGSKTVIASEASAKFTYRLVPDQNPEEIKENTEKFLRSILPPGIKMRLEYAHGAAGMVVDLESKFVEAAAESLEKTFGRPPVYTRQGGSIPIVSQLSADLNADVLMIGFGLDDDNLHAPNEKFSLHCFHQGIQTSATLWNEIAKRFS